MKALGLAGAHARWILAAGIVLALIFQDLAALMRPALAPLVTLTLALAFMRIDIAAIGRSLIKPSRLASLTGLHILLAVMIPAALFILLGAAGLPESMRIAATYTYLGPPIASAAALALLLGLNARLTIEFAIVSSVLAPLTATLMAVWLLGEHLPIDAVALGSRLAGMILLGAAIGSALRYFLKAERIDRNALSLDGIGALAMFSMIFPLFHGAREHIGAAPVDALSILILVICLNLGLQILVARISRKAAGTQTGGAIGLCAGNRNAAMLLAVLPEAQEIALFVALYQVPMYLTPLLAPWVLGTKVNPLETIRR